MVNWEGPVPPARPSKVILVAPFKLIVPVVLALVIESAVAPVCGLIIIPDMGQALGAKVTGNVSTALL